jgi:hypothetical protein
LRVATFYDLPGIPDYDAYVAIRDILAKATTSIVLVDAYIGSTLFATLKALPARCPSVGLLTADKALKPDFTLEASHFQSQFPQIKLEVRTAQTFHDRFIVIDDSEFYHVGASIKDAGKRAFLISRLEDPPITAALSQFVSSTWDTAKVVI